MNGCFSTRFPLFRLDNDVCVEIMCWYVLKLIIFHRSPSPDALVLLFHLMNFLFRIRVLLTRPFSRTFLAFVLYSLLFLPNAQSTLFMNHHHHPCTTHGAREETSSIQHPTMPTYKTSNDALRLYDLSFFVCCSVRSFCYDAPIIHLPSSPHYNTYQLWNSHRNLQNAKRWLSTNTCASTRVTPRFHGHRQRI